MTSISPGVSSFTTSPVTLTNNQLLYVGAGIQFSALAGIAADHSYITVYGTLVVSADDLVVGDQGIVTIGGTGTIYGAKTAIELDSGSVAVNSVLNAGHILGEQHAFDITGTNVVNTIHNTGTVDAGINSGSTIQISLGGAGGLTTIINSGTIRNSSFSPTAFAIDGFGSAAVHITNTGTITGNITLGTGADNFDTSAGTFKGVFFGDTGADTVKGSAAADSIGGGDGNDSLIGNGGSDTIDGGTGGDTMTGGAGNDLYFVDNTGDKLAEGSNAGTDTVETTINFTLGSNFENLRTTSSTGTSGLHLAGNSLSNAITGNAGHNVLTGEVGADTLTGGQGQDLMAGNTMSTLNDVARDVFKYTSVTDSGTTASTQDVIWGNFDGGSASGDRIDLSALATGNPASGTFQFLASNPFTLNHPGQVRVTSSGNDHIISINTDNDAAAEMTILVHSQSSVFTSGEFIF